MRRETWLAFFIGAIGAAMVSLVVPSTLNWMKGWNSVEWASWVQAVGVIAGLWGAVGIARWQEHNTQHWRRTASMESEVKALELCVLAMKEACALIRGIDGAVLSPDRACAVALVRPAALLGDTLRLNLPFTVIGHAVAALSEIQKFQLLGDAAWGIGDDFKTLTVDSVTAMDNRIAEVQIALQVARDRFTWYVSDTAPTAPKHQPLRRLIARLLARLSR